jgi:hypothetical protein
MSPISTIPQEFSIGVKSGGFEGQDLHGSQFLFRGSVYSGAVLYQLVGMSVRSGCFRWKEELLQGREIYVPSTVRAKKIRVDRKSGPIVPHTVKEIFGNLPTGASVTWRSSPVLCQVQWSWELYAERDSSENTNGNANKLPNISALKSKQNCQRTHIWPYVSSEHLSSFIQLNSCIRLVPRTK